MSGSAPLLRTAANSVSHSPSRIPHLRFHIALRQTRSRQKRYDGTCISSQQRRCQTTLVASDFLEKPIDASKNHSKHAAISRDAKSAKDGTKDDTLSTVAGFTNAVQAINVFDFLEEGILDRILSGLMSDSIGTPFILQAHDLMFKKALLALDPDYFVEPFKDISRHTKGNRESNKLESRSLDDRLSTFAAYVDRIVAVRRESGKKLDLEMCNHLLRCAGSMGDKQLASSVFQKIIPEDGIKPNLETYNYYCQALLWSNAFGSTESYNLRVIPRNLQLRAARKPPKSLSGHVTTTTLKGVKGIRQQILDVFQACINGGYAADEFLFTNLMIAMSREADIDGVKSILKSVWNIDLDMLGAYDEEELQSPTFYEDHHPLRPTERLLFAVAHIFGSNNDIRTAWLLVDFISRNYNLPASERVWESLCESAFLLSIRRTPAENKQGRAAGKVSRETLVRIVETMADAPNNIEPSSFVQYLLSRIWMESRHLDKTVHHIEELEKLLAQQHTVMRAVTQEVMDFANKADQSTNVDVCASLEFYNLRRRFMAEYYKFQRDMQFMNIAVSRLFKGKEWPESGKMTGWTRRKLPDLLPRFGSYLPPILEYETRTGTVRLETKYKRRAGIYDKYYMDYRVLPRIHNAMDTDDQRKLRLRMASLPEVIVGGKQYCFNCEQLGHHHSNCPNKKFESSTLDYAGEESTRSEQITEDVIYVLDPQILRTEVPFAFEVGGEKDHSNPSLPFT